MDSFFNGRNDEARFELVKKYINHLFTPNMTKICSMIEKLGVAE